MAVPDKAASKTRDEAAIAAIRQTNDPARAKQIGRAAPLVDGWESGSKFTAMEEVVTAKFDHNPDLACRLLATEGSLLVEGNTWHDQIWGSCRCDEHCDIPGANALSVILMAVRLRLGRGTPPAQHPGVDSMLSTSDGLYSLRPIWKTRNSCPPTSAVTKIVDANVLLYTVNTASDGIGRTRRGDLGELNRHAVASLERQAPTPPTAPGTEVAFGPASPRRGT